MREITAEQIEETVRELCIAANRPAAGGCQGGGEQERRGGESASGAGYFGGLEAELGRRRRHFPCPSVRISGWRWCSSGGQEALSAAVLADGGEPGVSRGYREAVCAARWW